MQSMLYEVCKHIKNFFPVKGAEMRGEIKIENGAVDGLTLANGQYFLIEGSVFSDGVHQFQTDNLTDETFEGCVTPLAVPKSFAVLVGEIEAYNDKLQSLGAYSSESFGGYSYALAKGAGGGAVSWAEQYRTRLNAWRKV